MKILWIGISNVEGMAPLDARTKTGKWIADVEKRLQVNGDKINLIPEVVTGNILDSQAEEHAERMVSYLSETKPDVIVMLGGIVAVVLGKRLNLHLLPHKNNITPIYLNIYDFNDNARYLALPHPSYIMKKGRAQSEDYKQELIDTITDTKGEIASKERTISPEYYKEIFSLKHLVQEFGLQDAYEKELGEESEFPLEESLTFCDREDLYNRMLKYINVPSCVYSYFYISSEDTKVWPFYRFKTDDLLEHITSVTVPVTTKNNVKLRLSCDFCCDSYEQRVSLPKGWKTGYAVGHEPALCPKHSGIFEFFWNCAGCVASWEHECALRRSFMYPSEKRAITEEHMETISRGYCPFKYKDGIYLSPSQEGYIDHEQMMQLPKVDYGVAFVKLIKEYCKKYPGPRRKDESIAAIHGRI